jgi:8-oxo-dGTP pyrophosphatase MutT (NUDIX family)
VLDHRGDGDGWTRCAAGHRHWGRFGAAGLLLSRPASGRGDGDPDGFGFEVLLQHRAGWSHHGGTWGLPGGARESTETALSAAFREAAEEGGLAVEHLTAYGRFDDDHGGWAYATVLASAPADTSARPTGGESIDVAWRSPAEVADLPLHPGFAASWPALRGALTPLTLVVDAANVVGSRPDGWWKDRAGAARRLVDDLVPLAADGLPGSALPDSLSRAGLTHWWPRIVVVVEGAARAVADDSDSTASAGAADGRRRPGIAVVAAPGSGDDAIVDQVGAVATAPTGDGHGHSGPNAPVLVVTADRELRRRVEHVGAAVTGPGWLDPLRG